MNKKLKKFLYKLVILLTIFIIINTMLDITRVFVIANGEEDTEDVFDTTLAKKITAENYGDYAEYDVDLNNYYNCIICLAEV